MDLFDDKMYINKDFWVQIKKNGKTIDRETSDGIAELLNTKNIKGMLNIYSSGYTGRSLHIIAAMDEGEAQEVLRKALADLGYKSIVFKPDDRKVPEYKVKDDVDSFIKDTLGKHGLKMWGYGHDSVVLDNRQRIKIEGLTPDQFESAVKELTSDSLDVNQILSENGIQVVNGRIKKSDAEKASKLIKEAFSK